MLLQNRQMPTLSLIVLSFIRAIFKGLRDHPVDDLCMHATHLLPWRLTVLQARSANLLQPSHAPFVKAFWVGPEGHLAHSLSSAGSQCVHVAVGM